ncbi:LamG-like jellyroll fold domain-containing protein [Pedosphaera parvula]|uniref:Arabinan endo-1,5-alpha-L-arabinosidase n=1 Tax=Pedosphaera parvula (strain Ellin514) TaxID=320771 RepID=B9XIT2_PEDPL|nr:LamG-like jellyroll fold domain-containing protein [Pedosphaera parvula]EEF60159.1 Arabinan endo-1,5-alpha-L-arabinosidase [Pedosphaera parvula Ellin514]
MPKEVFSTHNLMSPRLFLPMIVLVSFFFNAAAAVPTRAISPRGYLSAHDPSTMIQCKDRYYIFSTGQGILSRSSSDQVFWSSGPAIFTNPPAWTTAAVPGFAGIFWAPDILFFNNKYYLYYAVSTFGSQVSAIGLATNTTLDPIDPAYQWIDQGPVIQSTNGSAYNTIDPSFTWDNAGNLWMAFGSYWNGIYLVQLSTTNGMRVATNSPTYHLAYNGSIEASCIYRRGGYYYLFVNWGSCCSGVNSTYNIRVGRSTNITGPYLDRNGVDMVNGGGTLFMQGNGKYDGPGHVGIISDGPNQWFTYHYYDANAWAPQYGAYGNADFDFVRLAWTADDWPTFTNDWSATYRFQADAADDQGQYSGLLQNGATIQKDSVHDHVLNLNGTNQYVWLPPGVGNAKTFVAVVKWRGGGAWQRIFDFGVDTSKTIMLTPASGDNVLRCDLNPGGNLQTVQWNQPLPSNVWTHVALTLDGTKGVLYVNGAAVATNNGMNLLPVNVASQTNHLGRSKFTADPYFNGQYASFRVYGRALSAQEIAAPLPLISEPHAGDVWWPGESINFNGEATDFADVPLSSSNLSWQISYVQDSVTNLVFGPASGISSGIYLIPTSATGNGNYVITLTATDNFGRQSSKSITLSPANRDAGWSSYFPLRNNAADALGHFNGTLNGAASFVNDSERGQVLNLSGANQFATLAGGAGAFQTFMGWIKWNGGAAWQKIFDCGNDTSRYTSLTPSAANGKLRFNISLNSIPGEQIADASAALPVGVWTHVAVVLNGTSVMLYTNGALVASNLYANLVPANLNATNFYLGKSQWPDPYFNGRLSSIRLFSRPLASWEIAAPQVSIAQPAQGSMYQPGDTISFSGTANDFYDTSISPTGLVWTVSFINGSTTNTVLGPLSGSSGGSFNIPTSGAGATNGYYRIALSGTDSSGLLASNSVSIFPLPNASGTEWNAFYPFDSGARDAGNRYNGSLFGGAGVTTDPTEGSVLNLTGGNQYMNLPATVGIARTFSAWVKWRGGNAWQRIFDFGRDTQHWFFLTPKDSSGMIQCGISPEASTYVQVIESQIPFPLNQWCHVTVTMDGRQGILFLNGNAIAVNNSVNVWPSDVVPVRAFIGRSEYSGDPYLNAQLDSVYLDSEPLSSLQVMQNFLQPTLRMASGSGQIGLSWPAWAGSMQLYTAPSLSGAWTVVTNTPLNSGTNFSVTLSLADTNSYFRLQWP